MSNFTRESVTAAFEQIIAQYGADHRYEKQFRSNAANKNMGCYYTLPRVSDEAFAPACIVGHLVYRLEPYTFGIIGALEEETGNSCGASTLLDGLWASWSDEDGNIPEDAHRLTEDWTLINAVSKAQSAQDGGGTWGEAYQVYREYLELADRLDLV